MATGHNIGKSKEETEKQQKHLKSLASTHRLRLKPPTYDGKYATFAEWKYKFKAYMGMQDNIYPELLSKGETAMTVPANTELTAAAGRTWGSKALDRTGQQRQVHPYQHSNSCSSHGVQTTPNSNEHRSVKTALPTLCNPPGNKNIGYLTKLLKPTFNHGNFIKSFSTWDFDVERSERDDNTEVTTLMSLHQHVVQHEALSLVPTYRKRPHTLQQLQQQIAVNLFINMSIVSMISTFSDLTYTILS